MDRNEFNYQEFHALRAEIQARQNRMFWTIVVGLLGMPMLTYVAMGAGTLLTLVLPLFVLVIIVLYLAEQNAMMRAGRYIREQLEPQAAGGFGWEAWLESKGELRLMEKHFFACFITIFYVFYFVSVAVALSDLWVRAVADTSGHYWYWFYPTAVGYTLSTLWGLSTLLHHWRSSLSTTVKLPTDPRPEPA